jgi:DNA ligase 1
VSAGHEATLQHGNDWQGQDVRGWYWSEKLNGCRARWTGAELRSRGGHIITAPSAILATLPAGMPLDLEVYAGVGLQEHTRQAVQYGRWSSSVRLVCFDAPGVQGDWLARIDAAVVSTSLETVWRGTVSTLDALRQQLARVQAYGGEGLIVTQPDTRYTPGRSNRVLKCKDQRAFEEVALVEHAQ